MKGHRSRHRPHGQAIVSIVLDRNCASCCIPLDLHYLSSCIRLQPHLPCNSKPCIVSQLCYNVSSVVSSTPPCFGAAHGITRTYQSYTLYRASKTKLEYNIPDKLQNAQVDRLTLVPSTPPWRITQPVLVVILSKKSGCAASRHQVPSFMALLSARGTKGGALGSSLLGDFSTACAYNRDQMRWLLILSQPFKIGIISRMFTTFHRLILGGAVQPFASHQHLNRNS